MTVVNLAGLERLLGTPGPIAAGEVRAEYWAGGGPLVAVDGASVVFPTPIVVAIVAGAPETPLDMEPTNGVCCVRWVIATENGSSYLERFTSIPSSGPVDFGDLPEVDPATFAPVDPTPTLVRTIDIRIEEYLGDGIAQEVADYLADNPPSAGIQHTQSVPSGSWVIAHGLGRLPNVAVYVSGELVETDVVATSSTVTVTFPSPTAGVAVLN